MAAMIEKINENESARYDISTLSKLEKGQMQMSVKWLARIAEVLGYDPRDLIVLGDENEGDTSAWHRHDVQEVEPKSVVTFTPVLNEKTQAYIVKSKVLADLGLDEGAILLASQDPSELKEIALGDVVIAEMRGTDPIAKRLILRMYILPRLLVTNSRNHNAFPINLAATDCKIIAKVLNHVRKIGQ